MNDETSIEVFNYVEDLDSYWEKGYGYRINYEIACPLMVNFDDAMQDVIDYWNAVASGKVPPQISPNVQRMSLRFAHAETIIPFVSLLGLFKDDFVLRSNSTPSHISSRLWRGSIISPFAGNIALVLYRCNEENSGNFTFKVKLLQNERELIIPGCGELYCPLSKFRQVYNDSLNNCSTNTQCRISGGGWTTGEEMWVGEWKSIIGWVLIGVFVLGVVVLSVLGLLMVKKSPPRRRRKRNHEKDDDRYLITNHD